MKKPKSFIITGHYGNKLAKEAAQKAIRILHNKGLRVAVDRSFGLRGAKGKALGGLKGDMALVFGGDGTMLYAVAGLKEGVPVLGINCGELGALMACGAADAEECIGKVLRGKYRVEERMRLAVQVDGRPMGEVLNELVVAPKETAEMMKSAVEINGKFAADERGDGIIVCSPTGSTGHALSAGGAVIDANCSAVEIVSMGSATGMKPRVADAGAEVKIVPESKKGNGIVAALDGRERVAVKKGVVVRKGSNAKLVFVSGMGRCKPFAGIVCAGIAKMPASAKLILLVLKQKPGMGQAELAKACGLPVRTVARSLKVLEGRGLVEKHCRGYKRASCYS